MTPEQRAAKAADILHTWKGHATSLAETTEVIAAAIREAVKEEREACESIADEYAAISRTMLDKAKKRFAAKKILSAVGYQGDPDAECIHLEALTQAGEEIAAAIQERPL